MISEASSFREVISFFIGMINMIIPVIIGLTLLVFFKGLVSFIAKSGDAKSHSEGKNLMIWGLVGLFVMISVFGILQFFFNDFGFKNPHGQGTVLPFLPQ